MTSWKINGYIILKDVFKPEECQALRDECRRIVDDFDVSQHPTSVFSTVKQVITINGRHASNYPLVKLGEDVFLRAQFHNC